METKICIRCKIEKLLTDFYRNNQKKDGLDCYCKKCHNEICKKSIRKRVKEDKTVQLKKNALARALYAKEPEKFRLRSRNRTYEELKNSDLKHKYNITFKDYLEIWNRQEGKCAICGQLETRKVKNKLSVLAVDHDHKTGKIRGLLCSKCNISLGLLNDNIDVLKNMIDYLNTRG